MFLSTKRIFGRAYGIVSSSLEAALCSWPSSELSHSILAMAISQVSLTLCFESDKYFFKTGMDFEADMAPMASAALLKESMRHSR